jgi:acyl-CoA thioesterase FadM
MYREIIIETQIFDLDWNRHITSRAYENFAYAGRMDIFESLGFPIQKLVEEKYKIDTKDSTVRFLAQQFAGVKLKIKTRAYQEENGLIHWNQLIVDMKDNSVCELRSNSYLKKESGEACFLANLQIDPNKENEKFRDKNLDYQKLEIQLNEKPTDMQPLVHSMNVLFSDLNIFWSLTNVAIWKFFEEGRFLFFKEVLGFGSDMDIDITTFFMSAKIQIYELPQAGSTIRIESWIDSVEKIRFYFRQDLRTIDGRLLASMRDEQLFVKLSSSRPCRVPEEFYEKTKEYRIV